MKGENNENWKMGVTIAVTLILASARFQCDAYAAENTVQKQQSRPNFITLVIDDMGFSDIGAFGGEVPTPNLDQLANDGIMLTNFYAAATSSPSRSMLFSGRDSHKVGFSTMGPQPKCRWNNRSFQN